MAETSTPIIDQTAAASVGLAPEAPSSEVELAAHMPVRPPAPSGAASDAMAPLRRPDFRRVWAAAAVSNIGNWMETFGVRWAMTFIATADAWEQAGHPPAATMLAWLAAAQLLPVLFLGMVGGIVADRVDRRKLLIVTQAMLMLTAGALAVASGFGFATATVMIAISLVHGITMAFNVPAWQVLTPRLVPREELARAIALNSLQFNMARVIGPLSAGLLMFGSNPTLLFIINTLSFLGVIIAVWRTPPALPTPDQRGRGLFEGAWTDTRQAVRFVFANRGPRAVFIGVSMFSIFAGPLLLQLPAFVTQVYGEAERLGSTLLAVMGLGAVLGAYMLPRFPSWYPRHHFIPLSMAGGGLTISLFCLVPDPLFGGAVMFLVGLFWIWSFSSSIAAMQLLVSDTMRGRVMAVTNTAVFGASPLGALLCAAIEWAVLKTGWANAPALGVQLGLGLPALVLLAAALVMLTWRTPEVDGINPGDEGYDRKPGLIRGILASGHRPRSDEIEATVGATGGRDPM
ncbi:MAG: MFS transporter [Phycisphaerales bacterium]